MKKSFRFLHIEGDIWRYKVFTSVVEVRAPTQVKYIISHSELFGVSLEEILRGRRKGITFYNVKPSMILEWIKNNT